MSVGYTRRMLKIISSADKHIVEREFNLFAKKHDVVEVQASYVESSSNEGITQEYVLFVFYDDIVEEGMV